MEEKITVLLVDDHEVVRAGIRNALQTLPQVQIIGELDNGKALFAFLAQHLPDCLLIDVSMPDFDAIPDIGKIRQQHPDLRILVVSAYDDQVYVQGLLGLGVDGYHLKDQPLSDLRLAVQRIMQGERWVSSRLLDQLVRGHDVTDNDAATLTKPQRNILRLLHKGLDNRSIAHEMGLSIKTVENHLTRLYKQLNVRSRLEAVNYTLQHPEVLALDSSDVADGHDAGLTKPLISAKPSILVVDDNTRYRLQLLKMIGNLTPRTLLYEAANIEQALALVQQIKPTLALVDVVLGDESGIHCVKQIRRISARTKQILVSAYPDSEFHRLGLEAGALAFVDKKDLDTPTLRQILDDMGLL